MINLSFSLPNTFKAIFKTLLFIALLLAFKPLSAQLNEDYFDVRTIYEMTSGGAAGSGSRATYSFRIKFIKDADMRFDTVWFDNLPKTTYYNFPGNASPASFKKGDSVNIAIGFYYPGERDRLEFKNIDDENANTKAYKNPLPEYKGIALIQFYVNNRKYYYGVKKIDQSIQNNLP